MAGLILILITFGLMWVLLIRPQQQRLRRQREVIASLGAGDEVITQGGIYGTVTGIDGDVARLEVAPGVELRVATGAIAARADSPTAADDEGGADHGDGIDEDDPVDPAGTVADDPHRADATIDLDAPVGPAGAAPVPPQPSRHHSGPSADQDGAPGVGADPAGGGRADGQQPVES